jgi:hypothetical protein
MLGNAMKVVHQGDGVLENFMIDALVNETNRSSCLLETGYKGIVDVPGSGGFGVKEIPEDLKIPGDFGNIEALFQGHEMKLLGCINKGELYK